MMWRTPPTGRGVYTVPGYGLYVPKILMPAVEPNLRRSSPCSETLMLSALILPHVRLFRKRTQLLE